MDYNYLCNGFLKNVKKNTINSINTISYKTYDSAKP